VEAVNTSAAARTPVYFCITGAAAESATASRYPFIAAQLLFSVFHKKRRRIDGASAFRAPAERSATYCCCSRNVITRAEPSHMAGDQVRPRIRERSGRRSMYPGTSSLRFRL